MYNEEDVNGRVRSSSYLLEIHIRMNIKRRLNKSVGTALAPSLSQA